MTPDVRSEAAKRITCLSSVTGSRVPTPRNPSWLEIFLSSYFLVSCLDKQHFSCLSKARNPSCSKKGQPTKSSTGLIWFQGRGFLSSSMATGTVYCTVEGVPNILYWCLVSGVPPGSAEMRKLICLLELGSYPHHLPVQQLSYQNTFFFSGLCNRSVLKLVFQRPNMLCFHLVCTTFMQYVE